MRRLALVEALLATMLAVLPATACATPRYAVAERYPLPADEGWDDLSIDAARHHLFITRSTHVQVLDLRTRQLVADLDGLAGVHGVAVADAEGLGFASCGQSGTVALVDLERLRVVGSLKVGSKPDAIIYEPASHRVLCFSGDSHDCTIIDAVARKVLGTMALGGAPESAAADERGHVFITLESTSELVELDPLAMQVLGRWRLTPGEAPTGLCYDARHHRLLSGCRNQVLVAFDTLAHKVVASFPIGAAGEVAACDPSVGLAFSANGDGTLTVVDVARCKVVQVVPTLPGARTLALDPDNHAVYLVTALATFKPSPEERKQGKRPRYAPGTCTLLVVRPEE